MKTSMISIVMPMYGVENYIEKAIRSVLCQDYQDWELLVINDGSTDRSREIASLLANTDSRIKIFDKENGGLSDARNYGLNKAQGEYVHFYDSDDWIEPTFYSTMISKIEDFDLLISGYKVDYENSISERIGYEGKLSQVVGTNLYQIVGTYINFVWNKLFKRSFLVENALCYESGLYRIEDVEFMMRFLKCSPKVKICAYSGYHYVIRNSATLSNIFDESILEHTSRSIIIHGQIYNLLCQDKDVVLRELGKLNFLAIKSILFRMKQNLTNYNIIRYRNIIYSIVMNENLCRYIKEYLPHNRTDKFITNAIISKKPYILLLMLLLRRK